MRRGELWWASLPEPTGSGPGFRRPVLIVQSNPFIESRIATVIVAVVTSNLALAQASGNVRLAKSYSGLRKESVVNVSQILTLDRCLLTSKIKALPARSMLRIDEGLQLDSLTDSLLTFLVKFFPSQFHAAILAWSQNSLIASFIALKRRCKGLSGWVSVGLRSDIPGRTTRL